MLNFWPFNRNRTQPAPAPKTGPDHSDAAASVAPDLLTFGVIAAMMHQPAAPGPERHHYDSGAGHWESYSGASHDAGSYSGGSDSGSSFGGGGD